jgi:phosphoribosyl 1,2-cyclic phosphodiesterase
MKVTFWGVRGSIPTPGYETARYGGNTLCVEVALGECGRTIVFDAGSGIRRLGRDLMVRPGRAPRVALDLFLTHTHLDHILGLPFFEPLYRSDTQVSLYGPATSSGEGLERVIGGQLTYQYFPVRQAELAADIRYVDLVEGVCDIGDGIRISATYLNHPLLSLGYRLECGGKVLCTAFDTEPFHNLFSTCPSDPAYDEGMAREGAQAACEANLRIQEFLRGADLLIHDGQFTEQEYRAGRVGWGHSSVEHAVGLAEASGSRRLALVHHDPLRTDPELDRLAEVHGGRRPDSGLEVCFAREGLSIKI